MTAGKWEQIRRTFAAALPERFRKRKDAVEGACSEDRQSERETVSRRAGDQVTADSRRTAPVTRDQASPLSWGTGSLLPGQMIGGRFRILRFLNSGGMGEVYEAWESELAERVALKTIRPGIASRPSVIERFKREVKQARVISHVNVCRVHDVFSHDQSSEDRIWFLTMELLEGKTLADRLRQQGRFQPKEALELIEQMVAGLAAAHSHGIVHRDFKSSNVMLVKAEAGRTRAVITDFGLALNLLTERGDDPEESRGGTPRYMAPEQERGGQVGFAADQYALGVVICEMLTGSPPSRPEGGRRILLPPDHHLSPRWEAAIRRCLESRPEDRFPHVKDVLSALNPARRSKNAWIMGAGVTLTMIMVSGALLWMGNGDVRLEGVAQLTPRTDNSGEPSLSRDGRFVAYSSDRAEAGNLDIWVQRLPSGRPVRLTTGPAEDVDPSISQDGLSVVFRSERGGGGIYRVDAANGNERLLVRGGRDPRFSPDDARVAYWVGNPDETIASGQLFVLSLTDGSSARLAADFQDARNPVWSSDGQSLLFTGCRTGDQALPGCSDWWVTSRDGNRVQNTGALALLRRQHIQPVDTLGGWCADAVVFSGRHGETTDLWRLRLSEKSLMPSGTPQQLTSGYARNVDQSSSLALNGTIAFSQLSGALHVWRIEHALSSKAIPAKVTQDAAFDISPYISHNGRWLVFSRGFQTHHDIWIKDIQAEQESLFLASSLDKSSPVVDDSGEAVAFEVRDQGSTSILLAARGKPARVLCAGCSKPTGWFDGKRGIFYRDGLPSKIKMADLETQEAKVVLEAGNLSLSEASWSPENQYLLFTASMAGGERRIFAVRFPKSTGVATGEWTPVTDGSADGDRARWSGDGKTIFYLSSRDGAPCTWGQHFDPKAGKVKGRPFPVMHFHNSRISPETVEPYSFELSVSGDSIYLNLGEVSASIWTGVLKRQAFFSLPARPR